MAKYLKLFNNHEDYLNFKKTTDFILPNVSHCVQENEVHYNPLPPMHNGHAYVDLGLTSKTKWAKMNVGASSEKEAGLYFAWGETTGYTADQVGNGERQKAFNWSDYKYGTSSSNLTKYNTTDNKTHLELTDDAAHVNWGGDWHMPNRAQCLELLKETKNGFVTSACAFTQYAWSDSDSGGASSPTETTATISGWNTPGFLFFKSDVSNINAAITSGDYLFVPAAGLCVDGGVNDVGGYVWASALGSVGVGSAGSFGFGSGEAGVGGGGYRCYGLSVRGVVGQMVETTV